MSLEHSRRLLDYLVNRIIPEEFWEPVIVSLTGDETPYFPSWKSVSFVQKNHQNLKYFRVVTSSCVLIVVIVGFIDQ